MSVGLWILLILLLLLIGLMLLPVGVDAAYAPEGFFLRVKAGPARITLLPKKPKKPKKPKPEKAEKKPKKEKKKPKITLDLAFTLARLALEAVSAFRKKLKVELFRLWLLIATQDPYQTATLYGSVSAALEALYPFAARALDIRERDVRVNADFTGESPEVEGRLILTIRIGQILGIGLVFAWKLFIWYLKQKSAHKKAA